MREFSKTDHNIINQDEGFTLLEVVVAVAITSLSFATLFSIISDSKFISASMTKRIEGLYLAETLLEEYSLSPQRINFPIENENDLWQWSLLLEEYDDPTAPEGDRIPGGPYIITVAVEDKYAFYTQNISLSKLVWLEE